MIIYNNRCVLRYRCQASSIRTIPYTCNLARMVAECLYTLVAGHVPDFYFLICRAVWGD